MTSEDWERRAAYYDGDGVLWVLAPNPKCGLTFDEIVQKDVPVGAKPVIVSTASIPVDVEFRPAWKIDGDAIVVDMPRARMIWREKLANARDVRLADMGRLYQTYIDNNVDPAPVIERRQALRDVTQDPAIEAAKTPEELKKVWPSILDEDV